VAKEGGPCTCIWLAFPWSREIWGKLLKPAQEACGRVVRAINKVERVFLLVKEGDIPRAKRLCGDVKYMQAKYDDIWLRDSGPVFAFRGKKLYGVDLNFNGWGLKCQHKNDNQVARLIAGLAGVPRIESILTLEGGGIEMDGEGTAMLTETSTFDEKRNPNILKLAPSKRKPAVEAELLRLFGIQKVIWLPGNRSPGDVTDGHIDAYARFTATPGVLLVHVENDRKYKEDYTLTRKHVSILEGSTDAKGRKLTVKKLIAPQTSRIAPSGGQYDEACFSYANFLVTEKAVIMPEFGDQRGDEKARNVVKAAFPKREVIQVNIDGIIYGGGGIHCVTQQQPVPS